MLRKLFYTFQVYGTIIQLYKDIYYKPNGEYMKSIQRVHKNMFMEEQITSSKPVELLQADKDPEPG